MAKGGAKILFGLFFFVVLVAGLAGGGAWYLTEKMDPQYRATALLQIGQDTSLLPLENDDDDRVAPQSGLRALDYETLFESESVAQQLLEALGQSVPDLDISAIRDGMDAEVEVALQSSQRVAYQQIVKLHFTSDDPEVAAIAANTWASVLEMELEKQQQEKLRGWTMSAQASVESLERELGELQLAQAEASSNGSPESLKTTMESRTRAVEELKQRVREAEARAARGEASLNALKTYVSKAPPAIALELTMAEATAEAEMAGTRAESEYLAAQLPQAETAASEARAAWVKASQEHGKLDGQIALLESHLSEHRDRLFQLRQMEHLPAPARIVSQAFPPTEPTSPHRYVIVAGAVILGAIAGMIVYFGLLTMRVYARELDRR